MSTLQNRVAVVADGVVIGENHGIGMASANDVSDFQVDCGLGRV